MDKRRCLKIALRIDTRLRAELSEGIDAHRMVTEALYARDVLLVCDAMTGTDLQKLANLYRKAALQTSGGPLLRAPVSISGLMSAFFGGANAGVEAGRPAKALVDATRAPAENRQPPAQGAPQQAGGGSPRADASSSKAN